MSDETDQAEELKIINPWVIVHQPEGEGGSLLTILVGAPGSNHVHFGIVIADIARHVAGHYGVPIEDVMAVAEREIDDPTSDSQPIFRH